MADLTDDVEAAVKAMPWLTAADRAAVALAVTYAEQIEAGVERGGQDATKALYLGPHLLNALTVLGGTPKGRRELELKEPAGDNPLASVRGLRSVTAPSKKRADRAG